jgi:nitroreductase
MGSAVSMRWLGDEPVPDELVDKLLWAATRASNPGNSQPWDFVVVRDAEQRARVAGVLTERWGRFRASSSEQRPGGDPTHRRMMEGVRYLIDHLAEAPVMIFICGNNVYPPDAPQERMMLSATYGAAQNLMVAARALGLGATYTTFHLGSEAAIKALLGIPEETQICVTIPVGWPKRRFGELNRRPLDEVVHYDHW